MQSTKWELYEYQRSRSGIDLGPNHLHSIFLNYFSSVTADFNISSAIRWAIQDQWSSGTTLHLHLKLGQTTVIHLKYDDKPLKDEFVKQTEYLYWRNKRNENHFKLTTVSLQRVNRKIWTWNWVKEFQYTEDVKRLCRTCPTKSRWEETDLNKSEHKRTGHKRGDLGPGRVFTGDSILEKLYQWSHCGNLLPRNGQRNRVHVYIKTK